MTGKHTIAFVNDEPKLPLAETIAFAHANGVSAIEMRSIEGKNLLSFTPSEQKEIARQIKDAGLSVVGLASPLLKWTAPGRPGGVKGDQFGFDLGGRTLGDIMALAADAAHTFGTRNVRIFSYLTHDGFAMPDLTPALDEMLPAAEREDLVFHVENEPVCNICNEVDLLAMMRAYDHPRLRALLDIGNIYGTGTRPEADKLAALMPYVDHMHFKDASFAGGRRRTVALGEGEIPYPAFIAACLAAARGRNLRLSVETHVHEGPAEATARSLAALKALAASAV
jgi:sugar phosphate isomerase/epimerase